MRITKLEVLAPRLPGDGFGTAGVCEKNIPFVSAFALQSCSRNCSPAPDLVLWKLVFPRVLLSGGVFFSQTPVSIEHGQPAARQRKLASRQADGQMGRQARPGQGKAS